VKILFSVLFAVIPSYMTDGTAVDQCQQALEFYENKLESYSPDCKAFEMLSVKGVPAVSKSLLEPALQEWQAQFRQHLVFSSAISPVLANFLSHTQMATHVPQTAPAIKRFNEVLDMLVSLRAAKMATRTLTYRDLLVKCDKAPSESVSPQLQQQLQAMKSDMSSLRTLIKRKAGNGRNQDQGSTGDELEGKPGKRKKGKNKGKTKEETPQPETPAADQDANQPEDKPAAGGGAVRQIKDKPKGMNLSDLRKDFVTHFGPEMGEDKCCLFGGITKGGAFPNQDGCKGQKPRAGEPDGPATCPKCLAFTAAQESDDSLQQPELDDVRAWVAQDKEREKVLRSCRGLAFREGLL
jgi:hypothetical protein